MLAKTAAQDVEFSALGRKTHTCWIDVGTYRLRRGSTVCGVFGRYAARYRPGGPSVRAVLIRDLAGRLYRHAPDAMGRPMVRSPTGSPIARPRGGAVVRNHPTLRRSCVAADQNPA